MNWRFIKQFPKFAIAAGVILVSTGLFAAWWYLGQSPRAKVTAAETKIRQEVIQKKAALLPERIGSLALVGVDLFDVDSGEKVFANWLGGIPQKLVYHPGSNKIIVIAERGLMRFAMDGSKAGVLGVESLPAYTQDAKQAVFVRGGDIWMAEVDWQNFVFAGERQVTHYGQFYAPTFYSSVALISSKALVVRNLNQLLWVNLESGDFKPAEVSMNGVAKRRSPNGRYVIGDDGEGFFRYDVDTNNRQALPKDWERMTDCQWLGNDRCALLVDKQNLRLFDNRTGSTKAVATLPNWSSKVMVPSPSGKYVICSGVRDVMIADLESGNLENFGKAARDFLWVGDDRLICSVETPDAEQRGTWMKVISGQWQRLLSEPYAAVGRSGSDLVVFGTRNALFRMKSDGTGVMEVAKLARPVASIQGVGDWEELASQSK